MRGIILLIWFASTGLAIAAEDFAEAMQAAMANLRTATSYARTGNTALAQLETNEATANWQRVQDQSLAAFAAPYPPAALETFLSTGRQHLDAADRAFKNGDNSGAGRELLALRRSFHDLRHASGFYDLGDCIFEIAPAMEALRTAATRFSEDASPSRIEDVISTASVFRDRLQRCNNWASEDVSRQPEFRRLIDGAIASAGEIAHAATSRDGPLVHRYLIELQSYAQLLDFNFG
ncbi:MAG TPA: hypothetical protein VHN11_15315 [Xanthobacteraceae bacterium]|nr:hypothetical protein [Xanthobacteraceae bacterium]